MTSTLLQIFQEGHFARKLKMRNHARIDKRENWLLKFFEVQINRLWLQICKMIFIEISNSKQIFAHMINLIRKERALKTKLWNFYTASFKIVLMYAHFLDNNLTVSITNSNLTKYYEWICLFCVKLPNLI